MPMVLLIPHIHLDNSLLSTTNASSKVTFSANAGEIFDSTSAGRDYTLTVTATGSGSLSQWCYS